MNYKTKERTFVDEGDASEAAYNAGGDASTKNKP